LKPANLFYLEPDARGVRGVKILDFGIAKAISEEAEERAGSALVATEAGNFAGSPPIKLALGLHDLHVAGAIHRDLKPLNIFVVNTGPGGEIRFVLLDWGCAKTRDSVDTSLDQSIIGTAAYMAPEQHTRARPTGATDLYALAIILIEMLWRHPFVEDGEPQQRIGHRHLHEAPPEPPTHFVPPRLWLVLKMALEKDPANRYASCKLFAEALRDWLSDPDEVTKKSQAELVATRQTVAKDKSKPTDPARASAHILLDAVEPAKRIQATELSQLPSLLIETGINAGVRYELIGYHKIGSHPGLASIVIEDEGISKKHAVIEGIVLDPRNPVFSLIDVGSLNGTAAAGIPLANTSEHGRARSATLLAGTTMQFDDVQAVLRPAGRLGPDGAWQTLAEAAALDQAQKAQLPPVTPPVAPAKPPPAPHQKTPIMGVPAAASPAAAPTPALAPTPIPTPTLAPAPAPAPAPVVAAEPDEQDLVQRRRVELSEVCLAPTLLLLWENEIARVELEHEGVIGSWSARANITIEERQVSKAHCSYQRLGHGYTGKFAYLFVDLRSRNGMLVKEGKQHSAITSKILVPGELLWLGGELQVQLLPPGLMVRGKFIPVDANGRRIEPRWLQTIKGLVQSRVVVLCLAVVVFAQVALLIVRYAFGINVIANLWEGK